MPPSPKQVLRAWKPHFEEALAIPDTPLLINHDNVEAVRLLSQAAAPKPTFSAEGSEDRSQQHFHSQQSRRRQEMEGESQEALKYYDSAAAVHSDAAAVVYAQQILARQAGRRDGRAECQELANASGHPDDPRTANGGIKHEGSFRYEPQRAPGRATRLPQGLRLDPSNAFANNNIGYLSEIEGDRETAQFFYDRAQALGGANTPVGLATRSSAEGMRLGQVASDSDAKVEAKVQDERSARRQRHEPILLLRRDNSVVQEPARLLQPFRRRSRIRARERALLPGSRSRLNSSPKNPVPGNARCRFPGRKKSSAQGFSSSAAAC